MNDVLARNRVIVVAAGNDAEEASFASPANCNGVITVAAIGRTGQRASYSNFDENDGTGIQVEIAAPGGSGADGQATILSTLNSGTTTFDPAGHNYVTYHGTSMATPHVAGIVSLMLSLKPSLTPGAGACHPGRDGTAVSDRYGPRLHEHACERDRHDASIAAPASSMSEPR